MSSGWYPADPGASQRPQGLSDVSMGKLRWVEGFPIAPAWRRVAAAVLDFVGTVAVPVGAIVLVIGDPYRAQGLVTAVVITAVILNSVILPVSLGKALLGIQVVRVVRAFGGERGATRVGIWRTLVRLFLHVFEAVLYLWLVPFINRGYNRGLSDVVTHVIHIRVPYSTDHYFRAKSTDVDLV